MARGFQQRPGAGLRAKLSRRFMVSLACLAAAAGVARGEMTIRGYQPILHDRFYSPASASEFIGGSFDLSGIGQASTGQWATLISPDLFLTSQHYATPVGGTVTFYADNTYNHPETRTVAALSPIAGGDIMVGRLSSPTTGLAIYPLPALTTSSWYAGHEMWVYGNPNVLGRNIVSWTSGGQLGYVYDNPGVGADECYLQPGDSGAPSFEVFGDRLVIVGTHYGIRPTTSIDSWTAGFISQIVSQAGAWGEALSPVYLPLPGDANLDGFVGPEDFSILKDYFGASGAGAGWSQGNFNADNQIGPEDMSILREHFGQSNTIDGSAATTTPTTTVITTPEPVCLSILSLAGLAIRPRRRRR